MTTVESGGFYEQDPNDTLDYTFDWSRWLPSGDTIADSIWIVPAGIIQPFGDTNTSTLAVVWLKFDELTGIIGDSYLVTNRISTTQGRVKDWSFQVYFKHQ